MGETDRHDTGTETEDEIIHLDADLGGDPACWLNQVCPQCGRLIEDRAATVCPACGAARDDD